MATINDEHALCLPEHFLYFATRAATTPHALHAVKLSIPIEGTVSVQTHHQRALDVARTPTLVAAHTPNVMTCEGGCLTLFFAPEAHPELAGLCASAARFDGASGARLIAIARAHLDYLGNADAAQSLAHEAHAHLTRGTSRAPAMDWRARRAAQLLQEAPHHHMPLPALAAAVGLSPGRLVHVFREAMGLPLRRYALWLKLRDAFEQITLGVPLADAAARAGFSDHAHLTRTARAMLGRAPSDVSHYTHHSALRTHTP